MANQLKMAVVQTILTLTRLGWSQRQIARKLGIHRETVARYIHSTPADSKPASNPIPGSEPVPEVIAEAKPASNPIPGCETAGVVAQNPTPGSGVDATPGPGRTCGPESLCEPFRAMIEAKVQQGLTGQRIHQDLVEGHGFAASYSSVRRFLQRLGHSEPLPFRRLEVLPGEQAQVDFGTGAPILRADGKRRRPHVFRVVLSFSRKAYSEVVYHQTTENFLRCLENAFWYFGGVPQTLVIDNLKAAVPHADWYDPDVHPKIQSFCQHYGTVILEQEQFAFLDEHPIIRNLSDYDQIVQASFGSGPVEETKVL
jgi:transposase